MPSEFNITIISKKNLEFLDLKKKLENYFELDINFKEDIKKITCKKPTLDFVILDFFTKSELDFERFEIEIEKFSNLFLIVISKNSFKNYNINSKMKLVRPPIHLKELIMLIENIFKKYKRNKQIYRSQLFDFSAEKSTIYLYQSKKTVKLTELESKFLDYLLTYNRPASKNDLLSNVWMHQTRLDTHTLESLVYRLRIKIEEDPKNPKILVSKGKKYSITNFIA